MLGAIIGDIVGSKYEFNNIKTKKGRTTGFTQLKRHTLYSDYTSTHFYFQSNFLSGSRIPLRTDPSLHLDILIRHGECVGAPFQPFPGI